MPINVYAEHRTGDGDRGLEAAPPAQAARSRRTCTNSPVVNIFSGQVLIRRIPARR